MKQNNFGTIISLIPEDFQTEKTRSIIKSDQFSVTRILLPADKHIPDHKAPSTIMIQCINGLIELTVENSRMSMEAGSLILLEKEVVHSLHAIKDSVVLLTMFEQPPKKT
jgi:quercetin dioxygenase-like cupin family protein